MFACHFNGCEKTYESKYSLKRHFELQHCKSKRFRCRVCSKCLSSKQSLQEHSYTHSKVKPYVCQEACCGIAFRQKSLLSIHKKVHSSLKKLTSLFAFKELKVKLRQLTSLQSLVVRNDFCFDQQNKGKYIELPLISGEQTGVILPSLLA